jgi:hypothetical protein
MKVLVGGVNNHYTDEAVQVEKVNDLIETITAPDEGLTVKHNEHEALSIKESKIDMGFIVESDPFDATIRRLRD